MLKLKSPNFATKKKKKVTCFFILFVHFPVLYRAIASKSVNLGNNPNGVCKMRGLHPRRNGGVQNKTQNPNRIELAGRLLLGLGPARYAVAPQPGKDPLAQQAERGVKRRRVKVAAGDERRECLLEGDNLGLDEEGGRGRNGVVFGEGEGDLDAEVVAGRENECGAPFVREVDSDPHYVPSLYASATIITATTLHHRKCHLFVALISFCNNVMKA